MTFADARAGNGSSLERYFRDLSRCPPVDREEEARLARRIRGGDSEALHELIRANMRFVVHTAKKYQGHGVPLPDLISEGNLGLIRAARRFDETKGVKFISYAVWWIRQAILSLIARQKHAYRLPQNRAASLRKLSRCRAELVQELDRDPTPRELAEHLGVSTEEVVEGLRLARADLSLEAPITHDDEGDATLLSFLPDDSEPPADEQVGRKDLRRRLDEALSTLSPRQAKILRLYFGLDGQGALTLQAISDRLSLSRERIRQIKEKALRRLRHPSRARYLEG